MWTQCAQSCAVEVTVWTQCGQSCVVEATVWTQCGQSCVVEATVWTQCAQSCAVVGVWGFGSVFGIVCDKIQPNALSRVPSLLLAATMA